MKKENIQFAVLVEYCNLMLRETTFLHICFYEKEPSKEDIESLKEELASDEEFEIKKYFQKSYVDHVTFKVLKGKVVQEWLGKIF